MATIKRETNANFINWKPVEASDSCFTPCGPLEWLYEVPGAADCPEEASAEPSGDSQDALSEEEAIASLELARITPSNDELMALAAKKPPPEFPDDEESPF